MAKYTVIIFTSHKKHEKLWVFLKRMRKTEGYVLWQDLITKFREDRRKTDTVCLPSRPFRRRDIGQQTICQLASRLKKLFYWKRFIYRHIENFYPHVDKVLVKALIIIISGRPVVEIQPFISFFSFLYSYPYKQLTMQNLILLASHKLHKKGTKFLLHLLIFHVI